MKFTKKPKDNESKKTTSAIISEVIKSRAKKLKISKLSVKDKKNFEEAKATLERINGNEYDSELNFSHESMTEISLADIIRAINELSCEPSNKTKCITECSSQMALDSDTFWTSPRAILRAIKYSILRRNWDNITHFLLLLLHHKDQYITIVRKVI